MPATLERPEDNTPNQPIPPDMQRRIQQWHAQNNDKARKYAEAIAEEWRT